MVKAVDEHDFTQTREQWELSVFRNATYFTVIRRAFGRRKVHFDSNYERKEFLTFKAAVTEARSDPRALVYAVTAKERDCMVRRDQWDKLMQDYPDK